MKFTVALLTACALAVTGCKNDPVITDPPAVPAVVKAVYVLNEGAFSDPTGARLTLYDVEKDTVYRDVYESANSGSHLGNLGDDMKFYNGKAYIVMSGSKNLVVMDLANNRKVQEASFPGSAVHDLLIDSTRNRLYLTRLFSSSVFVLNLSSLAILDSIRVGSNPLGMIIRGAQLYVCNSGYGDDSTVTVADVNTNAVTTTLRLGKGPSGSAIAPDGKIWFVCAGNPFATPPVNGKIFIVDPASNLKVDSLAFNEDLFGTITIGADGYAYVIGSSAGFGGAVHRISTSTKAVTLSFIAGTFYGLGYDDVAREIYLADAKNFANDGEVKIYTTAGAFRKTLAAQKGPAVFGFKR